MAECLGGCGFFASADSDGYCSVCARRKKHKSADASEVAAPASPSLEVGQPGEADISMEDDSEAWNAACLGAALDDERAVQVYLSKGDPPNRRITAEESQVLGASGVWVDAGSTLLDVALERDSTTVVMLLTEGQAQEEQTQHLVRRRLSSLEDVLQRTISASSSAAPNDSEGRPSLPQRVREALDKLRCSRPDGLCYFDLPSSEVAPNFFLPVEVGEAAPEWRNRAMGLLIEAHDCLQALEAAVGWWRAHGGALVLPLYTSADLNCLLHACSLALAGVRDTFPIPGSEKRCLLRDALHESLARCPELRTAVSDATRRVLPAAAEEQAGEAGVAKMRRGVLTAAVKQRIEEVISLARQDRTALDGAHIFGLAQVLRRPLICHAPEEHEGGEARHVLSVPFRVSGLYLPLLWEPADCSPEPLLLAYTRGHYTGLCPVAPPVGNGSQVAVPLYDAQGVPLPVPFAASARLTEGADAGDAAWAGWAGTPPDAASGGTVPARNCDWLVGRYLRLVDLGQGRGALLRCAPFPLIADQAEGYVTNAAMEIDGLAANKRRAAAVLAKYRAVVGASVQRRLQAEDEPPMEP